MVFTEFKDSNNEINSFLHKTIFGENSIFINDNIFSESFISISGSSILQIYNTYILKNNENINVNDVDIYIQPSKQHEKKIENVLFKLVASGYEFKSYRNDMLKSYDYLKSKLKIYLSKDENNSADDNKYSGLSKYIYTVITCYNKFINKSIDIIFIKCDIKKFVIKTFDFDIIKNYYCNKTTYIYNTMSILNKTAIMTEKMFKSQIFNNFTSLQKFIKRYNKYKKRGYNIYIENNIVPVCFITKIIKLLNELFQIDHDDDSYTCSCNLIFETLNCGYYLLDFYYKTFYTHKEIIEYIYNPKNIFKTNNSYLLD